MINKRNILLNLSCATVLFNCGVNADIDRGLTPHFSQWLTANGYSKYIFERTDLVGGAYGGKTSDSDKITH